MNEIQTTTEAKTFFTVREGSNYLVTQINRKEHVIEFEQFKKLAKVLNNSDVLFVSINDKLVNKNRIEDIEPTKKLTAKQEQAKVLAAKAENERQARIKEIETVWLRFRARYMDGLTGEGKWGMLEAIKNKGDILKAFAQEYPTEAAELEKIT